MKKMILMRELIALIKEVKGLDKWKVNQGRNLDLIHARWLMFLNESPQHVKRLNKLNLQALKENIIISRNNTNRGKDEKFVSVRYEKAKTDLILLITEQIKNPD